MIFRALFIGWLFLLAGGACMGQIGIQLPAGALGGGFSSEGDLEVGRLGFQSSDMKETSSFGDFRLPSHVKSNPRGFSPLCRLELRIEDRLPVGVWVKLGEKPLTPSYLRSNAEVRFKLFRF